MKQAEKNESKTTTKNAGSAELRNSPMMAHLLDALEKGTDIGHYGRLTFVMVARHFLSDAEIVRLLADQPGHNEAEAKVLLNQVKTRDYNPPKRERILEWQSQQEFQICPNSDDPGSCNVYSDLTFPDGIYENIEEYYEEQLGESDNDSGKRTGSPANRKAS